MDINQIIQTELSFPRVGVQETSREAYYENREAKGRMVTMIVGAVLVGNDSLKALQIATGLPQSSCAGRVNDAIKAGLLKYDGEVEFMGRRRKRIVLV